MVLKCNRAETLNKIKDRRSTVGMLILKDRALFKPLNWFFGSILIIQLKPIILSLIVIVNYIKRRILHVRICQIYPIDSILEFEHRFAKLWRAL